MTKIAESLASKYQNDHPKTDRDGPKMDRDGPKMDRKWTEYKTYMSVSFCASGGSISIPQNQQIPKKMVKNQRNRKMITFNRIINIAIRIIKSEKFFYQHVITIFIFTFPIQNITTLIHHNISTVCLLSFQNFCHGAV